MAEIKHLQRSRSGLAVKLLVIGASLAVACGLVEAGLRAWIPASNVSLFRDTPSALSRVMKPNVRGVVYGVPMETNNMGFRDEEDWVTEKPPGERRIVIVGDSFTVSAGVPFARIYSERLERRLQALGPAGNRLRVMNLAVGGYSIVRYAVMLTEVGLPLDPDAIIVGVFPYNDFTTEQPPPARGRFETWRLYRLWRVAGWSLKSLLTYRLGTKPEPEAWEANISALKTIAELARRAGIPVTAILLPNVVSDFSGQRMAHEPIQIACQRIGMTCVDALDDFLASGIPARRFTLNLLDGHPNAR